MFFFCFFFGMNNFHSEIASKWKNGKKNIIFFFNPFNWHQVCNMISYKRDVLER